MDINVLKNEAQELIFLQSEAKKRYNDLVDIGKKLNELVLSELVKMKDELVIQFDQYFTNNDFEVTKTGDTFKALFKDLVIILDDQKNNLNDYEAFFDLEIPLKRVNYTIVIKVSNNDFDRLYYKKNLDKLFNHGFKDVNARIDKMTEKDDLKNILGEINENIDWFQQTVDIFDNVKFVFTLYKSHEEYESFQELFESIKAP